MTPVVVPRPRRSVIVPIDAPVIEVPMTRDELSIYRWALRARVRAVC